MPFGRTGTTNMLRLTRLKKLPEPTSAPGGDKPTGADRR